MGAVSYRLLSVTALSFSLLICCVSSNNADCRCVNMMETFAPLSNCKTSNGTSGILLNVALSTPSVCVPLDYGSNRCMAHHMNVHPACSSSFTTNRTTTSTVNDRPRFCSEAWCYVDMEECIKTNETVVGSTLDEQYPSLEMQLFYSYSVCNSSDEWAHDYATTNMLEGKTLLANIPTIWHPYHYKRTANGTIATINGPEYYNDSHPWEGTCIKYLNALVERSNLAGVEYTHRSRYSDTVYSTSPWSAAVVDVSNRMCHLSNSLTWINPSRLERTTFSAPFHTTVFQLFVQRPDKLRRTLRQNASKVLNPFHNNLWAVIILCIFAVSALNIWLVMTNPNQTIKYRLLHGPIWETASLSRKIRLLTQTVLESFMMFAGMLFGGDIEAENEATWAQRILFFGFSFFVLLIVSAYTANLTAFLTLSADVDYIKDMHDAVGKQVPICVHRELHDETSSLWPKANFIYTASDEQSFENIEKHNCSALVMSVEKSRFTKTISDRLCQNHLASTGDVVLGMDSGFPVEEQFNAGISYWIKQAEIEGIKFQTFLDEEIPVADCDFEISGATTNESENSLERLKVGNFLFPIVVCSFCAIVAIISHCKSIHRELRQEQQRRKQQQQSASGRNNDKEEQNNTQQHVKSSHQVLDKKTKEFLTEYHDNGNNNQPIIESMDEIKAILQEILDLSRNDISRVASIKSD